MDPRARKLLVRIVGLIVMAVVGLGVVVFKAATMRSPTVVVLAPAHGKGVKVSVDGKKPVTIPPGDYSVFEVRKDVQHTVDVTDVATGASRSTGARMEGDDD